MPNPWMKFYPQDWQGDEGLQMSSLAARGLWMEMLCIMHKNGGYLSIGNQPVTEALLAIKVGVNIEQVTQLVSELENLCVFSRTRNNVIYSRRMLADLKKAKVAQKNGKNGGNPTLGNHSEISASDNPPLNQGDNPPKKPEARNQNKYWWSGEIIKLTKADYDSWFRRFKGSDDKFVDWLNSRDRWYQDQPVNVQKNWFIATSKAIEKLEG